MVQFVTPRFHPNLISSMFSTPKCLHSYQTGKKSMHYAGRLGDSHAPKLDASDFAPKFLEHLRRNV